MSWPILQNKVYHAPSVFSAENLLREARRQRSIAEGPIATVCILDPDGDITQYLIATGQASPHPNWACYHTKLYKFMQGGIEFGIVPYAVGASFAVLVAEELFASACQLLISITSAGQINPAGNPPYFVMIERALRDEGTSYHYMPPARYSHLEASLGAHLMDAFELSPIRIIHGATWTTDAPFRETPDAIEAARAEGIFGVEMEAAALYALASAKSLTIVCFAHITNQMAVNNGDFEKGVDGGSHDALTIIQLTAKQWLAQRSIVPSSMGL